MVSTELLRRDVRLLGDMLGDVLKELVGQPAFELVEEVRHAARARRAGTPGAEQALSALIARLDESQVRVVARAFGIFFDLTNLAEDLQRIRVLRKREQERHPEPLSESIAAAIAALRDAGFTAEQTQAALDKLSIELVFTAHPSEAKRRAIRAKLRRMRRSLAELDREDLLPRERQRLTEALKTELTILWQTEFLRHSRPTVLQEVERGLSITPRLAEVVPHVYEALRAALARYYPGHTFNVPLFLRFGSWMGGDRDGHPHVTADITAQTLIWLREAAIKLHLAHAKKLYDFLSISAGETGGGEELSASLTERAERWPELAARIEAVSPVELYRRQVTQIWWRLEQTQAVRLFEPLPPGAYGSADELVADLQAIVESLHKRAGEDLVARQVQAWLDLARVFGLHLTCLDIRQDSRRHLEVMTDLFQKLELCDDFDALPEAEKQDLLTRTMPWREALPEQALSPLTQETLALFRLLRSAQESFGSDALGGHIISMTQKPSDMLIVLWLWRWAQAEHRSETKATAYELRIIPLFEKIGDLQHGAETLSATLAVPQYREHLARQGLRQVVMVGYSDSTKDGGYLAACWGLYQAQSQLQAAAVGQGVQLTFFHGRGGSLGRGGGPAARGILSLPSDALDGSLRLTEQGEVLAERYDDLQIAYRHLEQVTWATLLASATPANPPKPAWLELMNQLSASSLRCYRHLVELPGFIQFFAAATPIEEIENLPIGSRPSRRRGERTLGDLRAIPWVFSWTQNRCLIPAWYGLGTALAEICGGSPELKQAAIDMYQHWPFFQAAIDNAALALVKADMGIAARYAGLAESPELKERFWTLISQERDRTRQAILDLVGGDELLSTTPWLQGSIEARNPYIDPLNLMQIELLKRRRALETETPTGDEPDRLRSLLRLTVQGVAAGMRTTG